MRRWLRIEELGDPDVTRNGRILVSAVVLSTAVGLVVSALTGFVGAKPAELVASSIVLTAIAALTIVLAKRGKVVAASHFFCAVFWLATVANATNFGGLNGPGPVAVCVSLLLAVVLLSTRFALLYGALTALAAGLMVVYDERLALLASTHPLLERTAFVTTGLALTAVFGYIAVLSLRQALAAARNAREELRQLIETSPDAIATHDLDGRLTDCNPAMIEMMGRPREDLIGRLFHEVGEFDPADLPSVDTFHKHTSVLFELRPRRSDGKRRVLENHATLLQRGDREVIQIQVRDVTARKEAEASHEVLEQQIQESRRLEAIGRLAGGVAHDFNNILTGILSYCDLLSDDELPTEAQEDIAAMRSAAQRAADLTRQLLAFASRQVLEPEVIDLNGSVDGLRSLLGRLLPENIALDMSLAGDAGNVRADPSQLEQVIVNLVVNARDAMPSGGALTIESHNIELDAEYASAHEGVEPGHYVLLGVSDTGGGMDQDTAARVFDPFFTTKDLGQGTGLGLATVHGIVRQFGGHIFVYSEIARGTTFKVYLPHVKTAATQPRPELPIDSQRGGAETILLVDDDELVRDTTARALQRVGYNVLVSSGGEANVLELTAQNRHIDLLVTDVVMPQVSGPELAALLRKEQPTLPVLYMSGYTENGIVHSGALDQGLSFLAKPFTPAKLRAKVRELLDGVES